MRTPISRILAILICIPLAACASSPEIDPLDQGGPSDPLPPPESTSIGFHLAKLDNAMQHWEHLKTEASQEEDLRKLRALERSIARDVHLRLPEIVAELESGPPQNRIVASIALGFGNRDEVLGPLLVALDDRERQVTINALIGLGKLARPDTPLAQICYLLRESPHRLIRVNAAYAMLRLVSAGARDDCAIESCREAMSDSEPEVKAQSSLVLGMLEDAESVQALGDLLYSEDKLVSHYAANALLLIGLNEANQQRGAVARLLVGALDHMDPESRPRLHHVLVQLAGGDFGRESGPWREWAYRLPDHP